MSRVLCVELPQPVIDRLRPEAALLLTDISILWIYTMSRVLCVELPQPVIDRLRPGVHFY